MATTASAEVPAPLRTRAIKSRLERAAARRFPTTATAPGGPLPGDLDERIEAIARRVLEDELSQQRRRGA